jgi:hypothetical protein
MEENGRASERKLCGIADTHPVCEDGFGKVLVYQF